jgi:hypothetical protein
MSIQFVEKLCHPEQFLKKEQDEPGVTKVLGKGTKSKIGEIMKLPHFGLPQFGERFFNYLLQNQQLPTRFQILEDLMPQDIFVHKTAAFEPCQKKGTMLVLRATHSYYKQPCFDAVSFLHNGQMHFGLARMIFAFNKGNGRHMELIWIEKLKVVQQESQYRVPCVKSENTFHLVELKQITDLFAAYPDFGSPVAKQYFLRPPAVSSIINLALVSDD